VSSAIINRAKLLYHKFLWILHNNILWFYLTYLYHFNVSISVSTIFVRLKMREEGKIKMKNNKMKIFIFRNECRKKYPNLYFKLIQLSTSSLSKFCGSSGWWNLKRKKGRRKLKVSLLKLRKENKKRINTFISKSLALWKDVAMFIFHHFSHSNFIIYLIHIIFLSLTFIEWRIFCHNNNKNNRNACHLDEKMILDVS